MPDEWEIRKIVRDELKRASRRDDDWNGDISEPVRVGLHHWLFFLILFGAGLFLSWRITVWFWNFFLNSGAGWEILFLFAPVVFLVGVLVSFVVAGFLTMPEK